MGYRSDVALAVKKQDFVKLKEEIDKIRDAEERDYISTFLTKDPLITERSIDNKVYIILQWQNIKWYDDYPEIIFLNDFLKDKQYDLLIIGEAIGDIEVHYGTDDYILSVDWKIVIRD